MHKSTTISYYKSTIQTPNGEAPPLPLQTAPCSAALVVSLMKSVKNFAITHQLNTHTARRILNVAAFFARSLMSQCSTTLLMSSLASAPSRPPAFTAKGTTLPSVLPPLHRAATPQCRSWSTCGSSRRLGLDRRWSTAGSSTRHELPASKNCNIAILEWRPCTRIWIMGDRFSGVK